MATPPLGFIVPSQRTQEQQDAHAAAMAGVRRLVLPSETSGPVKVMLTDFWKNPDVVADVGREFNGFHQLTGSCVGVSAGNAAFTLSAVQRVIGTTKAFIPWWPFAYGITRRDEGDRGQGEGAVDSVMGATLGKVGSLESTQPGLPAYTFGDDGILLTEKLEYQWSDGARIDAKWMPFAQPQTIGSVATCNSPDDIKAAIINGYPVLDGCDNYVGNGSIHGAGDGSYVKGRYDGRGGHSTCFLGYWDHPTDGPLFLYSNQWPTSTYPKDPAGAGRCCVWLPLTEVTKLFRTGGDSGETMALSHLNYFPAQPKVLDWTQI